MKTTIKQPYIDRYFGSSPKKFRLILILFELNNVIFKTQNSYIQAKLQINVSS